MRTLQETLLDRNYEADFSLVDTIKATQLPTRHGQWPYEMYCKWDCNVTPEELIAASEKKISYNKALSLINSNQCAAVVSQNSNDIYLTTASGHESKPYLCIVIWHPMDRSKIGIYVKILSEGIYGFPCEGIYGFPCKSAAKCCYTLSTNVFADLLEHALKNNVCQPELAQICKDTIKRL